MKSEPITLSTGREAFDVTNGGESKRWEYDVLHIQLIAENLERKHALRVDGNTTIAPPTSAFLAEFASELVKQGLDGCTIDAAFRVYNVVRTQFRILYASLESQITNIAAGVK